MKILFVLESLAPGGAELALVNLLPALRQRGYQCEVASLWPPDALEPQLHALGAVTHRLDVGWRWNLPQAAAKLAALIRRTRPDVVHAHLFFGIVATGLSRPLAPGPLRVATFHNLRWEYWPARSVTQRLVKRFYGAVVRRGLDCCTGVSAAAAAHYREHLKLHEVTVIGNPIAVGYERSRPELRPAAMRARHGVGVDDFLIVTAGRLAAEKGHAVLVETMHRLHGHGWRPRLLIAGEGPERDALETQIAERELQPWVGLTGALPHDELMALFAAADLSALPSFSEAFPLGAAEPMMLGVPVVASRLPGLQDLIDDGVHGLLTPAGDASALADALARMMSDGALRARLAAQGKARVEAEFLPERIAARWDRCYQAHHGGAQAAAAS